MPGRLRQLEVPQVFEIDGRWYCVFCNAAEHWSKSRVQAYAEAGHGTPVWGTHYLMAPDAMGPWTVANTPFLDGAMPCRRYAGKIIGSDGGLVLLGFEYWDADGDFVGQICDPVAVHGTLDRPAEPRRIVSHRDNDNNTEYRKRRHSMAEVTMRGIRKSYDNHLEVIKGVDLEVKDGEFMVFVGPSGCGKSTMMRMVAGLESITGANCGSATRSPTTCPRRFVVWRWCSRVMRSTRT